VEFNVSEESVLVISPSRSADKSSGSPTKMKVPIEDDDIVVMTGTNCALKSALKTNQCDGPPWWYNYASDINEDIRISIIMFCTKTIYHSVIIDNSNFFKAIFYCPFICRICILG
jgi:hypothetical protein